MPEKVHNCVESILAENPNMPGHRAWAICNAQFDAEAVEVATVDELDLTAETLDELTTEDPEWEAVAGGWLNAEEQLAVYDPERLAAEGTSDPPEGIRRWALGAVGEQQGNPERICGELWFNRHGTFADAFGSGSEGRGSNERPPQSWWEDCVRTIASEADDLATEQQSVGELIADLIKDVAESEEEAVDMEDEIAQLSGRDASTIDAILRGDIECPDIEVLEAAAQVVRVETADLVDIAPSSCDYDLSEVDAGENTIESEAAVPDKVLVVEDLSAEAVEGIKRRYNAEEVSVDD